MLPKLTRAFHICEIALEAFFEDTKHLVAAGVRADIAHRKATATSREEFTEVSSRGERREAYLKSWLKERNPLGYESQGKEKENTYQRLLEAVSPDEHAVSYGFPNWKEFETSYHELATRLSEMSRPHRPTQARAPVVRNGSFLPVLKICHQRLLDLLKTKTDEEANATFVIEIFRKALKMFRVRYFPAAKRKTGLAGAPNTKPVFDSWGNLGRRDRAGVVSTRNLGTQERRAKVPAATVALNNAIAEDCNAEWTAGGLNLPSLRTVLRKTSLPTDFKGPVPIGERYVDETYEWVREHYDGTNKLHHLALLVGIVVASTLLPNLFMPVGSRKKFENARTPDEVREVYNDLEWRSKEKRGMSQQDIFVGMFTTLIIAIYEEESPLRRHMASSAKNGLGDVWTTKHSEYFNCDFILLDGTRRRGHD